MSKKSPLVSGIIIFLNGANFLQEAIESVVAQSYDRWELLLVDDGSTDGSTEIAVRYAQQHPNKIRYLEHDGHQNRGKNASRNLGLHQAKGEYIALLDHDDVWLPNKLEEQVAILEARPEAGMVYGRTRYWHSWTGKPHDRYGDHFTVLGILPDTLVKPPHLVTLFLRDYRTIASTCSILIRREVAERLGGYDEAFKDQNEDIVFLTKVYLEVPVFVAGGCWDCYRQHPDSSFSIALRTGHWHPKKASPSREMFLNWLDRYTSEKGVSDSELLDALRTELWPYRHPEERTPRQRFHDVCLDAGLVLVRGEDARPLLNALGDVRDPGLDGHTVAKWLLDAVPHVSCREPSLWVEHWPRLQERIEEFLGTLEAKAQAAGLARQARRIFEEMIEGKWMLRVEGDNVANLVFQPNDLETVGIAIKKAETKSRFDIQLNQGRLKVKSLHHYSINFLARADSPRSIFFGFARAHEPWDGLGLYKKIELTPEWQSFREDFIATADEDNARIHFDIGDSDIPVELSSVRLRSLLEGKFIELDLPPLQVIEEQRTNIEELEQARAASEERRLRLEKERSEIQEQLRHRTAERDDLAWSYERRLGSLLLNRLRLRGPLLGVEQRWVAVRHWLSVARLAAESSLLEKRGKRHRVLTTVCDTFPIYSQTFVYQELTQLVRQGFDVRLVYSKLDSRDYLYPPFARLWGAKRRLFLNTRIHERDFARYQRRMPEKVEGLIQKLCEASGVARHELIRHSNFLQAFSFARMVEAYRPEYLHSYFFYDRSLMTLVAGYLLNIPRGISCYADHLLRDYELKVVPLHLELCDIVIATSEHIKRELLEIAPQTDPNRIVVKPNGIDTECFPRIERYEPVEDEPFRLVSVSRIEPKKGLVDLVEAVSLLRRRGLRVEAHLVGTTDEWSEASRDYKRKLDRRISELDLCGRVHLEGRQNLEGVLHFLGLAHLFIAPFVQTETGDKDGIPTALLEAMATGLPAVATDAGSITEVIDNGRDGVVVPQRDPVALASAIEALLRDPERRRQLGHEAAEKVGRRYDVGFCENVFHKRVRAVIEARRLTKLAGSPLVLSQGHMLVDNDN